MIVELKNISITQLQKQKKTKEVIRKKLIDNLNYTLKAGTVVTIMGSSGSGKSTLLNFLTGVIDHNAFDSEGQVVIDKKNIEHMPTEQRRIGLLSQEGLLFPHMTVAQNLLYALPHTLAKKERKEFVYTILANSKLEKSLANVYPHTLSGGQQSRLALMRTMLADPKLLLLDEPFSKLDAPLRKIIRNWVWQEIENSAIPTLLVSHDTEDIYDKDNVCYLDGSLINE